MGLHGSMVAVDGCTFVLQVGQEFDLLLCVNHPFQGSRFSNRLNDSGSDAIGVDQDGFCPFQLEGSECRTSVAGGTIKGASLQDQAVS